MQELIAILTKKKFLYGDNLQVGKTKVFMRVDQAADLEHERIIALKDVLSLIKNAIRSFLVNRTYAWLKIRCSSLRRP